MNQNVEPSVQIYATSDQLDIWRDEADELGMNYSDYYKMMIAAGRRELGLVETDDSGVGAETVFEERVIDVLDTDDRKSFEQIVGEVVEEHYEDRIAEVLQTDDRATYDPREEGYFLDPE